MNNAKFSSDTPYLALERRIANTHGWRAQFVDGPDDALRCIIGGRYALAPKWTRDGKSSFDLIAAHRVNLQHEEDFVVAHCHSDGKIYTAEVRWVEHPDDAAAIRYAVAAAVVQKLEAEVAQELGARSTRAPAPGFST